MSKFRKQPIDIEAVRLTEKTEIRTREGTIVGYPGDWLLTGVEGEQYPCGDAIFKKTYHPTGPDKCTYCFWGGKERRACDAYEVCVFKWKEEAA
ncbi:MAG: hypothetical protein WC683_15125 [bacterium]